MRIKEILVESFKSPFFNLLAIANLSLAATVMSFPLIFTPVGVRTAAALNLPAVAAALVLTPQSLPQFAFLPPFIYLQWIFIGAAAKWIASQAESRKI